MRLSHKKTEIVERLNVFADAKNVTVYFTGSMSEGRLALFNPRLSDVDLLIMAPFASVNDYKEHAESAIRISRYITNEFDDTIDVFLMSPNFTRYYHNLLSILVCVAEQCEEDLIIGRKVIDARPYIAPSDALRKALYHVRARYFCNEYTNSVLPYANTEKSRKIAKMILRGLQFILLSHTPVERIISLEKELYAVGTFRALRRILARNQLDHLMSAEAAITLDNALVGDGTDDWPAWMIAQEEVAKTCISHVLPAKEWTDDQDRLLVTMGEVWITLTLDQKQIIGEKDTMKREHIIAVFADKATSMAVRGALSGVEELADLENPRTPAYVSESYRILVRHLQKSDGSLECFSAAVILFEYILSSGVGYMNKVLIR